MQNIQGVVSRSETSHWNKVASSKLKLKNPVWALNSATFL